MKSLVTKLDPGFPSARASSSARSARRTERASSVPRTPVVFGAMSESTASYGPGASASTWACASSASTSTTPVRTQASVNGRSGDQVHPHGEARRPHRPGDDLEEAPGRRAEIEHPAPGPKQSEAPHQLLELEGAARTESSLLGALEEVIFRPVRLAHGSDSSLTIDRRDAR